MVEAPLAHGRTAVQARHIRFRAAFVKKYQMLARRFILHPAPLLTSLDNVRTLHLFTGF